MARSPWATRLEPPVPILAAKLIHGLQRRNQRYGMVTMCIGTGMGAAGIFEKV